MVFKKEYIMDMIIHVESRSIKEKFWNFCRAYLTSSLEDISEWGTIIQVKFADVDCVQKLRNNKYNGF